jgi:glucan phosphoethanolaminetransferase (alkaline phosphatase superfamily)
MGQKLSHMKSANNSGADTVGCSVARSARREFIMKWSRAWRKIAAVLMIAVAGFCLFVLAADRYAAVNFGTTIDGDWFLLILASGETELKSFAWGYWKSLLSAFVAFAAAWGLVSYAIWRYPKIAMALMVAGVVYLASGGRARFSQFKPAYFVYDTVLRFGEYRHLASVVMKERTTKMPPLANAGRSRLVIIGESLTSRRMGVYGYGKDTTPNLARLVANGKLKLLPERRATNQYTARALMDMLLDGEHTQVWRDRAAGFRTVLVSAQDKWERYCGIEQLLFDACHERIYIRRKGDMVYDEELLPAVAAAMAGPKPWVIYVHLMGSHFDPGERVPRSFVESAGIEGFDNYDRSVRYTDWVVAQLVELAGDAEIRFTSDHGESVNAGRWRDPSDPALWFVPEMVAD